MKIKKITTILRGALASIMFYSSGCSVDNAHTSGINVSLEEARLDLEKCALYVAEKIQDIYYKPWMLSEVAATFIDSGKTDKVEAILSEAFDIAMTLNNPSYKADALMEVARVYTKFGQKEKAAKIAVAIEAVIPRQRAFSAISDAYMKSNDREMAIKTLEKATEGIEKEPEKAYDTAWAELAREYARLDAYDKALAVAEEISDPFFCVQAFSDLALESIKKGNTQRASEAVGLAMDKIAEISDDVDESNAYSLIAGVYHELGDKENCESMLVFAKAAAMEVKSKYLRPEVLSKLSLGYISVNKDDEALETAGMIGDDNYAPRALAKVAIEFANKGDRKKADEIFAKAMSLVASVKSKYTQANAMFDIVSAYLEIGDEDGAVKVAEQMRDDYNKPRAFAAIAVKYSKKGNLPAAHRSFAEALSVSGQIGDNFYKSWALAVIALKYSEAGMKPDEKAMEIVRKIADETSVK